MANLFTNRSGRQVEVPSFVVPPHYVTTLMALQEEYEQHGEHLSLLGVFLDILDKGASTRRNQWKNVGLQRDRREFAKAVAPYMTDPVANAAEIQRLAKKYGMIQGTPVDLSAAETEPETEELTEEQLDAATAPAN